MKAISVSSIQAFQRCQRRWCYAYVDKRVPKREPTAFTVGKMVHEAFEDHFTLGTAVGTALADRISETHNTLLTEYEDKAIKEATNLIEPLNHWADMYPVDETLEVEEAFEWTLPNGLIFQGRPDRVVRIGEHLFHMQHKTISASRALDTFIQVAARSMHELLYAHALSKKYPALKNGGTLYNIVRKLKYKSEAKGKNFGKILHEPHEFFLQHPIPITPWLQQEALQDLDTLSQRMKAAAQTYKVYNMLPPSTRAEDEDMFSKRTDPYFDVLMGHASLDDDTRFMDAEERYT